MNPAADLVGEELVGLVPNVMPNVNNLFHSPRPGLVLGLKSKIRDGSREGTPVTLATAVGDFRIRPSFEPQLILRISTFSATRR